MFRISLEDFEGPLDLLLFFIRRDELDIYNIPISRITADFIGYIAGMQVMNLEIAAEFIYMASMLMSIKARMLLPRPSMEENEQEEYDPRAELVQRLLEYKRIKEAALKMQELEMERASLFARGYIEEIEPEVIDELDEELHRPTLYQLMMAYRSVINKSPAELTRNVSDAPVSVEEQSALIFSRLQERVQVSFRSLFSEAPEHIILVVTFLAVLELCKNRKIIVLVKEGYDDFWISGRI
ncbi:segregation and condensation protein A [Chlorobium phaeobacteroides]|uniref:Segregation and condensation protein A n=1 Tax=Chlorobium phaeobacteroides (strain DSM 266 / SMG 266 / 2430) TaxID=290317 RepID=A1BJS5_CHLPD|nr:segregation/condensation protein A [Chlorobium phaeobacteroides]ABL66652.1 condensin subunit ScpA [Chlorobium phaeobacteroides DSM 266]